MAEMLGSLLDGNRGTLGMNLRGGQTPDSGFSVANASGTIVGVLRAELWSHFWPN